MRRAGCGQWSGRDRQCPGKQLVCVCDIGGAVAQIWVGHGAGLCMGGTICRVVLAASGVVLCWLHGRDMLSICVSAVVLSGFGCVEFVRRPAKFGQPDAGHHEYVSFGRGPQWA